MDKRHRISRRAILKAVPAAATLIAVPDGLLTRQRAIAATGSFPQPPVWSSPTSILDRTLDVRLTRNNIPGLAAPITTRTYHAMIPGPTLRLRGGDTLRLTQINGLPPNGPFNGDHNIPHHFNSFNLHTHGLHVSPAGDADNVLREFTPRAAGESVEPRYVSTIGIPSDHPAGTFWYHPHYHGSVATQLAGGMAGVLIIEGDVDEVPEIAAAADVVVCVNELRTRDGVVPDFDRDAWLDGTSLTFTVNGVLTPAITMRPGEIQRWRVVAATAFTSLSLRITGDTPRPEMYQIAQDGITFPAPVAKDEVHLGMGNRADILVRANGPGMYVLRRTDDASVPPLMKIIVTGEPIQPAMSLPDGLPPGKPFIDDADVTEPGFERRVEFTVKGDAFPGTPFPTAYRVLGSRPTPANNPHDLDHDPRYGRFDPNYVNHTLRLGTVERWGLGTTMGHPFHLHTNHFLVTELDGNRLDPPIWQDTLSGHRSATLLARYEDFTGLAVLHCHNLKHEDLGMMQLIDYIEP